MFFNDREQYDYEEVKFLSPRPVWWLTCTVLDRQGSVLQLGWVVKLGRGNAVRVKGSSLCCGRKQDQGKVIVVTFGLHISENSFLWNYFYQYAGYY